MKAALIGLGRMGLRHLYNLLALKLDVVGVSDPFKYCRSRQHGGILQDQCASRVAQLTGLDLDLKPHVFSPP